MKKILILLIAVLSHITSHSQTFNYNELVVSGIGKSYSFDPAAIREYFSISDGGGTTSIRNMDSVTIQWKDKGYFQRNRDLGQIFIPKEELVLDAIVLRTGPSDKAVLEGAPGSKVFIQFFEVEGDPVINDNGTPTGTESTHGFSTNHRTDDFIEGITYIPFDTIYEGLFPENIPVTYKNGQLVSNAGKQYYMRWHFPDPPVFEANKRYAFIVGISESGPDRGFSLGNRNDASNPASPTLDKNPYPGGWGMRREGDGTIPPTMQPSVDPPDDQELLKTLYQESLFPKGEERFLLPPNSDGYPDVDTYRALEFYMEAVIPDDITFAENVSRQEVPVIFPNPVKSEFSIHYKNEIEHIEIFSLTGKLMAKHTPNGRESRFNINNLPSGVYILKIFPKNEKVKTLKLNRQ